LGLIAGQGERSACDFFEQFQLVVLERGAGCAQQAAKEIMQQHSRNDGQLLKAGGNNMMY
jgi:hypothetical protein